MLGQKNSLTMSEEFILFDWPNYQDFMTLEGYSENVVVPIPICETNEFNSSVLIRKSWLNDNRLS